MSRFTGQVEMRRWGLFVAATGICVALATIACSKPTAAPPPPPPLLPTTVPSASAAPAPAAMPATAQVIAPAAAPAGAAPAVVNPGATPVPNGPGAAVSLWAAPFFTVGNSWKYQQFTKEDQGHYYDKGITLAVTCSVTAVKSIGSLRVASIACEPPKSGILPKTLVLTARGLFKPDYNELSKFDPASNDAPWLQIPPRPFRKTVPTVVADVDTEQVMTGAFVQHNVAKAGNIEVFEQHDRIEIADQSDKRSFALGVGFVSETSTVGGDPLSEKVTLVDYTLAQEPPVPPPPPPMAGKPSVMSLPALLDSAGVNCAKAIYNLAGQGAPMAFQLLGRPLERLPLDWADSDTDVRPDVQHYAGKALGSKCSFQIEARNGLVSRIGHGWAGKRNELAGLTAALGQPAEHRSLFEGSSLDVWVYGDGVLTVYQPSGDKPDFEWWIYNAVLWPEIKDADAKIWQAFAYNDFAATHEKSKGVPPSDVVDAYQQALVAVPTYAHAALRLCKYLQKSKLGNGAAQARAACAVAQQSRSAGIQREAAKLMSHIK